MIFPNSKICLWASCACSTALQPAVKCMTSLISKPFKKVFFSPSQSKTWVKIDPHRFLWIKIFVNDCNFLSGWDFLPWQDDYLKVTSHYFLKTTKKHVYNIFEGLNLSLEKITFSTQSSYFLPSVASPLIHLYKQRDFLKNY